MITFRGTINDIIDDIPQKQRDFFTFLTNYFYSPGFRVLLNHRIGKYFFFSRFFLLRQIALYYKMRLVTKRNCDISYRAIIGKNVRFPHPLGIVIGDAVVIGDNCKIFQQVTLGSHGKKGEKLNYPKISNGVVVYTGAKVIGDLSIGENAIIGANSVVNVDVPNNATAVGIPCRIIKNN